MKIRLATPQDVPELMALEALYYVGNVEPSERDDGFISVLHSEAWWDSVVHFGGVHVADYTGTIAGFIAIWDPGSAPVGTSPIAQAMLGLTATLDFNDRPIAEQRFALRGPVLIDRSARGQGIYAAFNEVTRRAYADRFDLGILFVAADNPRSLHTTTTKLGATPLATFEVQAKEYHFLAYPF